MTPLTKAAALTFTGIILLAAILIAFSKYVLLESYISLENRHVLEDVHRSTLHLDAEIESLQRQLQDWATWDESYDFVQRPDPGFIARNLNAESFHRLQLSAVVLTDQNGKVMYGASLDQRKGTPAPLTFDIHKILHPQSPFLNLQQGHKGIYLLPTGPILIASEPIFDSRKSLPSRGVMVMCRALSTDLINKLETLTQLTLTLQPLNAVPLPGDFQIAKERLFASPGATTIVLSDSEIGGYTLVHSISGEPALILRAKTNRDFYREGLSTIRHFILWFSLAALLGGGIILWLFHKVTATRNEIRENEKIWQFALEGCGDGAWDWNVLTGDVFFSDQCKEILGHEACEFERNFDEWSQRIHQEDLPVVMEALEKIRQGDTLSCSLEYRVRKKNDEYCWISTRGKVIRQTADGKPARITGTITDTTEHRRMEEQIFKSQKLESVGVLAGGIAHDFNNILTALIGYTSLARIFINTPEKASKALDEAEKASHRATELTRQLLTFAKGGNPMKQCISVAHLLHESVSFALRGTNSRGNCSIPESLYVDVDEEQMGQAFSNIILNAAQAMPNGGEVSIEAREVVPDEENIHELASGPYIFISISDQGVGVPSEDLGKIFDPFFSTKGGCTGLGLSTAYSIIKKHGGSIDVHSTIGAGTTFTLCIPSSKKGKALQRIEEEKTYDISQCTGHILVMDDEEMIRNLSSELLSLLGYQVHTCSSGEEAIDIYKIAQELNAPFYAVIMDLTIPGRMGGKEAAEAILNIDREARLIVSSGYSNDPVMAEYTKYGFIAAISKPYTVDKMIKTMTLLGQQS